MDDEISPVIEALRTLNLNLWGKIYLSLFSDDVLWSVYVRELSNRRAEIKQSKLETYIHFRKICENEQTRTKKEYNFDKVYCLGKKYNMPIDGIYSKSEVIE